MSEASAVTAALPTAPQEPELATAKAAAEGGDGDLRARRRKDRDVALVEVDKNGKIRAYNHDCLSGDGPGTFGAWVSDGCSSAKEFGYVVRACILDDTK